MECAPIVASVGAGGYAGYAMASKIKDVMYNQMPKRPAPANRERFRRKIRRPGLHQRCRPTE